MGVSIVMGIPGYPKMVDFYNGTSIYKWMIARGTPILVNPNIWNISHNVEMKCGYYMI
jgi:hypothetical protein